MTITEQDIPLDVRGSIFRVTGKWLSDSANPLPGKLVLHVLNEADTWVNVWLECIYPRVQRIFETFELKPGEGTELSVGLGPHTDEWQTMRILRWAPGALGIPGGGGGEIFFTIRKTGDMLIDVAVRNP